MPVINPAGGSGTTEGRDGWCTPKWLADIINLWLPDLDPCGNHRSHISAYAQYCLPTNGLDKANRWLKWQKVFINPPYAAGQVIRWVYSYQHTEFLFLLRWDPSTEWYKALWPKCWGAWFPSRRINFEPPPGVKSSSNPFPHALYLKSKPTGKFLAALLDNGYLLAHGEIKESDRIRGGTGGNAASDSTASGASGGGGRVPPVDEWGPDVTKWPQFHQIDVTSEEWRGWIEGQTGRAGK